MFRRALIEVIIIWKLYILAVERASCRAQYFKLLFLSTPFATLLLIAQHWLGFVLPFLFAMFMPYLVPALLKGIPSYIGSPEVDSILDAKLRRTVYAATSRDAMRRQQEMRGQVMLHEVQSWWDLPVSGSWEQLRYELLRSEMTAFTAMKLLTQFYELHGAGSADLHMDARDYVAIVERFPYRRIKMMLDALSSCRHVHLIGSDLSHIKLL